MRENLYKYINDNEDYTREYVSMEDRYIDRLDSMFVENDDYLAYAKEYEKSSGNRKLLDENLMYYVVTNLSIDEYTTFVIYQCEDEYFRVLSTIPKMHTTSIEPYEKFLCDTFDGVLQLLDDYSKYWMRMKGLHLSKISTEKK